jgi:cytochrome b
MNNSQINTPEIKIWDIGVRLFHWLLVACVVVAIYTGFFGRKSQIDIHVIAGVSIATLVLFRLIWGVMGSTYARFSSFVTSPRTTLRHFQELRHGRAGRCLGHNPLGGWMIVALLLVLTAICVTGVITLGGVVKEGPLAFTTTFKTGSEVREVHEFLAILLAGLIGLHILGALFESFRTRENLSRAMISGRKRAAPGDEAVPTANARPLMALISFGVIAAVVTGGVVHFGSKPALGVPTALIDTAYAKECGACHSVHHPTVAPAATWRAIFGDLKNHFGENASLDPALTERLMAYAVANSSEQWDTRVANVMRVASKEQPLRLTDAPIWKRIHEDLPERLFKSKAIGGKLNCTNCHRDAETGVFAPRAIAIKKEVKP